MDWQTAHRQAMVAAFNAHEDLALNTFQRIEVFDAMVADGLRLVFRPLPSAAALYLPGRPAGVPGAIINASHPLPFQRYSAAHEYGHHVLGHGEQIVRDAEPRGRHAALRAEEMLAEAFAAWFLMPPEAAEPAMERIGAAKLDSAQQAYALGLRLGTSFKAICVHAPSLKLVKRPIADKWGDPPLKSLKQELRSTPPPGGWRHDVWVLTERDAETPLVVRAGDRLLFELPGHDVGKLPPGATAELLPPAHLFSVARWQVDLSPEADMGPATIEMRQASSSLSFGLQVERPRLGRHVCGLRVRP